MQILTTYLRRAAAVCLLAATAAAHGGQYRGPNGAVINVPAGQPVAGGPTTGGDAFLNINSWQVWWQLNHPRYVGLAGDTKDADRRDVAMPALVAALRDDQDSDVLSASLIALGKVAVDHPNLDVLAALRAHLPDGNQDVREAAILALGLSGIRAAAPDLASLLHDERPGRKLIERSKVGERARTFAAYSLGCWRSGPTTPMPPTLRWQRCCSRWTTRGCVWRTCSPACSTVSGCSPTAACRAPSSSACGGRRSTRC